MNDDIRNDLLAELAAAYRGDTRQPGDVDKMMLAAAAHISIEHAAVVLREKARRGELVEVRVFENSRWKLIYRRA